jgi:iron complex outermembrane recepter protein
MDFKQCFFTIACYFRRKVQMKIIGKSYLLSRAIQIMMAFVCLGAAVVFTYAQDGSKTAAKDAQKPIAIEPVTVTVTAQKEAEPALSAPLSVTAVTEDVLADANISVVKSAAGYAPNTFINEFSVRALSNPFFRGIGGSPTNPSVSTIIDGVPQFNSFSSNIELIDVGQVEFVRGPEGALYGRNTAGGLINITSRDISDAWEAQGHFKYGNYDRLDMLASAASPLLKNRFGISLAAGYSSRDGYTENDLTGHELDYREAGFGKAQLFYKAGDRLRIRFIYAGERDRDGDYALGDLSYIRANPHHVSRDFEGFNNRSVNSTTLMFDYHGSTIDFSSISGGVWWRDHALTDLDYQVASSLAYGLYTTRDDVENQHQFTQEFRFASSKDKPLHMSDALKVDWQAGVFIFNQGYQQDATNSFGAVSSFGFVPMSASYSSTNLGDTGIGVYGKTKFIAWKKLSMTVGLRFDYENKNADLSSGGSTASPSDSFSEVSPQLSLAYQLKPAQMAYVSVSRGYKAGGFNQAPTGVPAPTGTESYGSEHAWNYELGHKARWLGGKFETSAALFYIEWQDLQLNQQIPYSGGQYFIGNAGRANSKGLEIETRYRPFPWLDLFGMVGTTHAQFLSGSKAYNANKDANEGVGGKTLPFAPTFNANVGTQISWAPVRDAKLYLRAQVSSCGDFQYDASNEMGQTSYHLAGFRGGVRMKHWFIEGWVDNAFSADYVPIAIQYAQPMSPFQAPSGYIGESGAPRTYGVRLGINY